MVRSINYEEVYCDICGELIYTSKDGDCRVQKPLYKDSDSHQCWYIYDHGMRDICDNCTAKLNNVIVQIKEQKDVRAM